VGFAIHAAYSFRDVVDDVRLSRPQALREIGVCFEADYLAERAERVLDGIDRFRAVPLRELIVDAGGCNAARRRARPLGL
jgi:hypothetical protein